MARERNIRGSTLVVWHDRGLGVGGATWARRTRPAGAEGRPTGSGWRTASRALAHHVRARAPLEGWPCLQVAEADTCTVGQLRVLASLAFDAGGKELGVLALESALQRLLAAEPRHHAEIAAVLRELVHFAPSRPAAWRHFETALKLLEGFSAANAPFGTDELQWFLSDAWNKVRPRAHRRRWHCT